MKRTIINGLVAGVSVGLLAACGSGTTDSSSSGSKLMATTAACYTPWVSTTAYNGGATVSYASVNYTAAYWTQNQNPSTNNGPAGSGQPWISNGACGTSPTPTPAPTPTPTPTPTPAPTPTPTPAPTPTPTPATGTVTMYQNCNYTGWAASFNPGAYKTADLVAHGGVNDDASSIRIPSGYTVVLYKDDNFGGTSITLTGDNSCFTGINFNDATSSMVVFQHPGAIVNKAQLDFLKSKIAAGTQPWKAAYDKAVADGAGSLSYTPHSWQTVECGPYSNPDYGCSDEKNDAKAAYTQALLWYFSGNSSYAKKSIEIMNAWSGKLTGGHTNSNAILQAAWVAELWPRAAEIIRYTYSGWAQSDIDRFTNMLKTQYMPNIQNGAPCENGNWEASTIEGMMNIAVFTNDKALFDKAASMWRARTKAYLYLSSDGAYPVQPPGCTKSTSGLVSYWQGQSTFVDGLAQETCRDFGHTGYGMAAIINAAETARIQGLDLYKEEATRLTKAMEFQSLYQNGASVPSWLCGGTLKLGIGGTFEIGYNEYHNRLGYSLPQTLQLIQRQRPTGADHHIDWETLTHVDVGSVGIK